MIRIALAAIAIAMLGGMGMAEGNITAGKLRCEYLVNPLGLDETQPRLSWVLESKERNQGQTAYQILVAATKEDLAADKADLWDSGKVQSNKINQVVYAGKSLQSRIQCWWKVRVWDRNGKQSPWSEPAYWTMGLLSRTDWQAKWIGAGQKLMAPYLPGPKDADHNGFHSELVGSPNTTKWVTIDLGADKRIDAVALYPAHPYDWHADAPGFLFPVRFSIELAGAGNPDSYHAVADFTRDDVPNPGDAVQSYTFPSANARYVRLRVTKLADREGGNYGFALCQMQALDGDKVLSEGAAVAASDSTENNSWSKAKLTDGVLKPQQGGAGTGAPATYLRREFAVEAKPVRALAYVSGLGGYELRINGEKLGNHILAPEWTDYNKRVQYQTFDVTKMVREGKNAIAGIVGDSWYCGRIGFLGGRRHFGDRPWLMAQIEIEKSDGSKDMIVTDGSWQVTLDGAIRTADLLDGESQDLRNAMPGYDKPGFDAKEWEPVALREGPAVNLIAQRNEPISVSLEMKPVAITEPVKGTYVVDMGQNMVGWCRLKLNGPAGTTIKLRHAEVLNPDGTIYTANLREAAQTDTYVLNGDGEELLEPHFTYHGFRYIEVTGLPELPKPGWITGCVFCSNAPVVSGFECSDPMLNRLMLNVLWTQRANMPSVPTDCPQRNERMGWMGDAQIFSQAGCFDMDMAAFFTKWIQDIRDAQSPEGYYPDFAPNPGGGNAPGWADAGVVVPWRVYENYGDLRVLDRHYDSMKRYIESIRQANPDGIWRKARGAEYNDWLNGDTLVLENYPKTGGSTPIDVFATAQYARSCDMFARSAAALGHEADAKEYAALAQQIKDAFCKAFVKPDGRIEGNSQTAYAMALDFKLIPDTMRSVALKYLVEGIEAYGNRLSTGFQGTISMMKSLAAMGRSDVAYRLLMSHEMPSWGYMVDQGATTMWERWDGYVKGRGFQDPGMNSFSHYAYGAVGEWVVRNIAGLNPDNDHPGYEQFEIYPKLGGGITWEKYDYDSIRGRIATEWKLDGDKLSMQVTIPVDATALIYVPADSIARVTESGKPAAEIPGLKNVGAKDGYVLFEAGSGTYDFESKVTVK